MKKLEQPAVPPTSETCKARSQLTRIATLTSWTLSLVPLLLIPKCPACVAAYVLLFTGIGLSVSAAATIRWTLLTLSLTISGYLLFRTLRRIG